MGVRADRLVATLLILQTRGRITARRLAEELEVSEKTARRDLEALGMAGLPVYSMPGRNGGWQLLGGASTDLTGLTADEARHLFLAAGASLPLDAGTRGVLRKLLRALLPSVEPRSQTAVSRGGVMPSPPRTASWDSTAMSNTLNASASPEASVISRSAAVASRANDGPPKPWT